MTLESPTAPIAEDELLLSQSLARMLAEVWPEVRLVSEERNSREAVEIFKPYWPQVCFLDVRMRGLSAIGAERRIGAPARLVLVTATEPRTQKIA